MSTAASRALLRKGVRRGFASINQSDVAQPKSEWKQIYQGALSGPIKSLKRVSITSCGLSIVGMPTLLILGNNSVPMAGQVAVAGVTLCAAVGSTAILNFFTKPYIHTLKEKVKPHSNSESSSISSSVLDETREFQAQHLDLFGRTKVSEFCLSDVKGLPKATRPFVSYQVGERYFFVHAHTFEDKVLLSRMLGRPLKDDERKQLV